MVGTIGFSLYGLNKSPLAVKSSMYSKPHFGTKTW